MTRPRPPISDIAVPFVDRAASIDRQRSLDAGSKILGALLGSLITAVFALTGGIEHGGVETLQINHVGREATKKGLK
jgi:hypothetical protein